jgi:hypothetical protein
VPGADRSGTVVFRTRTMTERRSFGDRSGIHTDAVTNPTPPYPHPAWPQPERRGFWSRISPIQRAGLIAAALLLPVCGGTALAGLLAGGDAPARDPGTNVAGQFASEAPIPAAAGDAPATTAPAGAGEPAASVTTTTAAAVAQPVVTTKTVTQRKSIAFSTRTVKDADLPKGETETRTKGVAGVRTITYRVTLTGGSETSRKQISSVVTRRPVTKIVAVGTRTSGGSGCDPNYSSCVPIASDVDCAGGSGNGPAYVEGPVRITGDDIYDLDRDGDGVACDN